MQDTPNFESQRQRFSNLSRHSILDFREQIIGADRTYLESVLHRLELYFNDSGFRSTVPLMLRQSVEPNFENVLSYLQTISSWQQDGATPINGGNLQSQVQNISGQMQIIDQQLGGSYFSYFSSQVPLNDFLQQVQAKSSELESSFQNAKNEIEQKSIEVTSRRDNFEVNANNLQTTMQGAVDSKQKKLENIDKEIEKLLVDAKLLVGIGSGNKLADYYQRLANGRGTKENAEHLNRQRSTFDWLTKKVFSYIAAITVAVALLIYIIFMYINFHPVKIDIWGTAALVGAAATIVLIFLVAVSKEAIKLFNNYFPGGHTRTSALWAIGAISTTIFIAVYSAFIVHEMKLDGTLNWEFFVPKVIILLAPAYLVRLCVQNYRANAHLAVQYTHRATIMSLAQNYSDTTEKVFENDPEQKLAQITTQAKMDILIEAAKVMFAQSESGFITQKEGAGSGGDNMIDSINIGRSLK